MAERPAAVVSDESALEACIRDDALYKLTIFIFFTFTGDTERVDRDRRYKQRVETVHDTAAGVLRQYRLS